MPETVALIVAAGRGSRMPGDVPKQYRHLLGRPILRHVLEAFITHPAISEVQVFGIPHEKMGEEVCAWVQLNEGQSMTEDELKAFCNDQITHFKIPRHVRFVTEYPMTVTGKIQKFVMRDQMVAALKV